MEPPRAVVDQTMRRYYHTRAAEYDDWWLGQGLFSDRERPGACTSGTSMPTSLRPSSAEARFFTPATGSLQCPAAPDAQLSRVCAPRSPEPR
jgi:hypothetical protein